MTFFEVLPYLYVGDVASLQCLPTLHVHNITTIVLIRSKALRQSCLPSFAQNFVYHIIDDRYDGERANVLASLVSSCGQIIDAERCKPDGKIVICDEAGQDRAASVVVCYLIQRHGLTMTRAMEHVHICQPTLLLSAEAFRSCREFEIVHQTLLSTDQTTVRHKRSLDQVTDTNVIRASKQPMLRSGRCDED